MVMVTSLQSVVEALLEFLVVGFRSIRCEKTTSLGQVLHTAPHLAHTVNIWSKLEVRCCCVLNLCNQFDIVDALAHMWHGSPLFHL